MPSLKKLGVIDKIVKEPKHGAHSNPQSTSKNLKAAILEEIDLLKNKSTDEMLDQI